MNLICFTSKTQFVFIPNFMVMIKKLVMERFSKFSFL